MAQEIGLRARLDLQTFNAAVKSFIGSIDAMKTKVSSMVSSSSKDMTSSTGVMEKFGLSWSRIVDIISAVTIIRAFRAITNEVMNLGREALSAAAEFQNLRIQLEGILARDYAAQFGGTAADALGKVTLKAEELINWVRKLAVTTPFSPESLTQAIAYGQAFGFNVAQAKRLTIATGNFTSGMGLMNGQFDRIIYNFGQMLASGKTLGRELRDLANNFVPVQDIIQRLADQAGVPFEEMKTAMHEGRVSAEDFIATFVQMAEEDFPNAMARMSRTLSGVKQNITDFIHTVLGLELLGPLADQLAGDMADFLDAAFRPEVLRFFAVMGETLLQSYTLLKQAASEVIAAVRDLLYSLGLTPPTAFSVARSILTVVVAITELANALRGAIVFVAKFFRGLKYDTGNTFTELIQNASTWGYNLIVTFANGMAKAAVFVFQVLTSIARGIANLLKPGSPPKILPDLDWWGQKSMEIWLKGWGEADFSIFDDIAGTITKYLQALSAKIPETEMIPRILGTRAAISQAINMIRKTGEVTSSALNKIFRAAKLSSESIKDYIRQLFNFEAVSTRVSAVRKVLDFDIRLNVPTDILGTNVTDISGLFDVSGKISGDLGKAVRSYVIALNNLEQANKRVADAQKYLDDTTNEYDETLRKLRALQEDLNAYEDENIKIKKIDAAIATGLLTEEEKGRLEREKASILLAKKIRETERERDVAVSAAQDRVDAERESQDAAQLALDRQREAAQQLADIQLEAAQAQLDAAKALVDIQTENNKLMSQQLELLERLAKAAASKKGAGAAEPLTTGEFGGLEEPFTSAIEQSKEDISKAVSDLITDIQNKFKAVKEAILGPFKEAFATIKDLLAEVDLSGPIGFVTALFTQLGRVVAKTLAPAFEDLKKAWQELTPYLSILHEQFMQFLPILGKAGLILVIGGIIAVLGLLTGIIHGVVTAIQFFLQETQKVAMGVIVAWEGLKQIVGGILMTITGLIEGNATAVSEGLNTLVEGIKNFLLGTFYAVLATISSVIGLIIGLVGGFVEGVIEFFVNLYNEIVGHSIMKDFFRDMKKIFTTELAALLKQVQQWVKDTIQKILDKKDEFLQAGKDIIDQTKQGIKNAFTSVGGLLQTMEEKVEETWQKIVERYEDFKSAGQETVDNIKQGISDAADAVGGLIATMGEKIQATVDVIGTYWKKFKTAGGEIISGIIAGLVEKATDLYTTIAGIIRNAISKGNKESETESPSKVFKDMGINWIMGLEIGVIERARKASSIIGREVRKLTKVPLSQASFSMNAAALAGIAANSSSLGTYSTTPRISNVYNRNTNVDFTANYRVAQSESSIYYDLKAALISTGR